MSDDLRNKGRRGFLAGAAVAAAGMAGAARASGDPAILEVQPWAQELGEGVDARPYGAPSEFESHVVRRNVPWLTADPGKLGQFHAAARAGRHHHAERSVL